MKNFVFLGNHTYHAKAQRRKGLTQTMEPGRKKKLREWLVALAGLIGTGVISRNLLIINSSIDPKAVDYESRPELT